MARIHYVALAALLFVPASSLALPSASACPINTDCYPGCYPSGNDCFADRATISTSPSAVFVNTSGATTESFEPLPCNMGATVWYTFTALTAGTATIDTFGSTPTTRDTVLAVYTGADLPSLSLVQCNDDFAGDLRSRVTFACVAGEKYQIQLGGYLGATGYSQLSIAGCGPTPPSAPLGLAASASSSGITLSWSTPTSDGFSPITAYNLYRGTVAGSKTYLKSLPVQLNYTDLSVTPGTTYYYGVTAQNSAGESAQSNEASALVAAPPTAPLNLSGSAVVGRVSLSWTAPSSSGGSPITGYIVNRGTAAGGESLYAKLPVQLSFTDSSIAPGTTYYYTVQASNAAGDSVPSNERAVTTLDVPSAPTIVQVISGNMTVRLAWTQATSTGSYVTGYTVYRGNSAGIEQYDQFVAGGPTTVTETGLTNGLTYYYRVSATNAVGEGPMSNEIAVTPAAAPDAPRDLVATGGINRVDLQWSAPLSDGGMPIRDYLVHRADISLLYQVSGTTFSDTSAVAGSTYTYWVTAENSVGVSADSNLATAYVPTVPSAPALGIAADLTGINLTWTAPADGGRPIRGYHIAKGTMTGGETPFLDVAADVGAYRDSAVSPGVFTYYTVTAFNVIGDGAPSNEAFARTPGPPSAVSGLVASAGPHAGDATLTWFPPSDDGGSPLDHYDVYRVTGSTSTFLGSTNGTTFTDSGRPRAIQTYAVLAANTAKFTSPAAVASTTPWALPTEPRAFFAEPGPLEGTTLLHWDRPADDGGRPVTGYRIEARTTRGVWKLVAEVGDQGNYQASMIRGEGVYFQVSALNNVAEKGNATSPLFVTPNYVQDDPGDFGDAGNDIAHATPYDPMAPNAITTGILTPGVDNVDSFVVQLRAGPDGMANYCQTVTPAKGLDVSLRMLGGGLDKSVDANGAGEPETLCGNGLPGARTIVIQVVNPPKAPNTATSHSASSSAELVFLTASTYSLSSNCFGLTTNPCWSASEDPICGACGQEFAAIRKNIEFVAKQIHTFALPSAFYTTIARFR